MIEPGIYFVKAQYRRGPVLMNGRPTVWGWYCIKCNYSPFGTEGPPNETCLNCKETLYTKNQEEALCKIEVYQTDTGVGFRTLESYQRKELYKLTPEDKVSLPPEKILRYFTTPDSRQLWVDEEFPRNRRFTISPIKFELKNLPPTGLEDDEKNDQT